MAERRAVGFLALVSIGILLASLMLGLRPSPSRAGVDQTACLNPLDVVFILDKSGSMDTAAGNSTRLGEARDAIIGFINDLQAAGGVGTGGLHQVGLTTYAGDSAATPLALGATSAAGAIDIVDNIGNLEGDGNTPLALGLSTGLTNMTNGDRDAVDGVPVTQAFVLLSDGRPWPDVENAVRRPSAAAIASYLGGADQAFSVMIGMSAPAQGGAFILDPVLMDKLDKPNAAEFDGVPSDNFFHIQDAGDLGDLLNTIVNDLLCGEIQIDKTVNGGNQVDLPFPGGTVDYAFRVSHVGEAGSAPFTDVQLVDIIGSSPDDPAAEAGCTPTRGTDDPGDNDNLLEVGETWVYACDDVNIGEDTQNWGCVSAEFVNSGGATTADCDDALVLVGDPPESVPESVPQESIPEESEPEESMPEGSVGGGTGTPAASIPNTATSLGTVGGPLATLVFGLILVASLGTLAYANVRAARRR
jgi:hypothetical protein